MRRFSNENGFVIDGTDQIRGFETEITVSASTIKMVVLTNSVKELDNNDESFDTALTIRIDWFTILFLSFWTDRSKQTAQCANHLYADRNLWYSKWWPSFLLCCFWRVFSVYEELILLWFCLLDLIFKQHYYLRWFVWSEVLCFSISCLNHQTWREFRRITCLLVTWH